MKRLLLFWIDLGSCPYISNKLVWFLIERSCTYFWYFHYYYFFPLSVWNEDFVFESFKILDTPAQISHYRFWSEMVLSIFLYPYICKLISVMIFTSVKCLFALFVSNYDVEERINHFTSKLALYAFGLYKRHNTFNKKWLSSSQTQIKNRIKSINGLD